MHRAPPEGSGAVLGGVSVDAGADVPDGAVGAPAPGSDRPERAVAQAPSHLRGAVRQNKRSSASRRRLSLLLLCCFERICDP